MSHRVPSYLRQREKNRPDRAYTKINGRRISLGTYDSIASREKYATLIAGLPVRPSASTPTDPTISELLVEFLTWAVTYYDAREYGHFHVVARWIRQHAGGTPAHLFGPRKLKTIRSAMIDAGHSRKHINRQIVRVRQVITWAVSEEIIPAVNLESLRSVRGLQAGRSNAVEKPPIKPVLGTDIEATLAQLSPQVTDMVKIQLLLGCRPGELLSMQQRLIDRSGEIWVFTPTHHKNRWRGKLRQIAIGPRAQQLLQKYLFGEWCFQTPAGQPYLTTSYRRAISRACKRAGVINWTPLQLRHSAATTVRRELGVEAASYVLGHASISATQIYAEKSLQQAVQIAKQLG